MFAEQDVETTWGLYEQSQESYRGSFFFAEELVGYYKTRPEAETAARKRMPNPLGVYVVRQHKRWP